MKKLAWALLVPLTAFAGVDQDYATRWPLLLGSDGAGAYRVVLEPDVYRTTAWPDLRDVDIVDARGAPVAAEVFRPDQPLALPARRIGVPWFPLPPQGAGSSPALRLSAQVGDHGRILSVQAQSDMQVPTTETGRAFLLDLSHVRDDVRAVEIDWSPGTPREAIYRVETSDDLQAWQATNPRATLVELQQGDERLVRNEVLLADAGRYLRFIPLDASPALPIRQARVRLDTDDIQQAFTWTQMRGQRVSEQGRDYFTYESDGRYPVSRVDLAADDFSVAEWTLESRDAADAPWRHRAGPWVAYRVGGERQSVSPAQDIAGAPVRDRYWRLRATGPLPAQPPTLRLGYQAEVMVFLAQGQGPYALVAGSAAARRASAPMPALIDALRADRGRDWQPTPAYLAPAQTLAGKAALQAPPAQRDWKTWLLWGLLVLGAALVAGFAFSLLRSRPAS